MRPLWVETPLLPSAPLSEAAGVEVWLKLEAVQPAGSFKQRGMGMACSRAVAAGATRLVTSSGGNAGYAVAWCGRRLQTPVTVVVPSRTSATMMARIREEEAEVLVHGEVWDDAHAHALQLAADSGGALIHPFDHPDVWAGNATLVAEVAAALGQMPAHMVASVGGGGLLCGVIDGVIAQGWSTPVWGVETRGADSFAAARASGGPVTLERIDSLALTLGAKRVADGLLERCDRHDVRSMVVTDRQAVRAVERFLADHRLLVEPACGAALAPLYNGDLAVSGPVVVVVCGGASATPDALAQWVREVR